MGWTAYAGIGDGTRGVVWPQSVAMKITGHKTESIYRRYSIA